MQTLATKDELTSVLNRRAFTNALEREFKRAHRHGAALSLVLIDIDHFKNVNDCYGHLAGDRILHEMAMVLKKTIREIDVLARYGGEEFVIILPETNLDEASITAQRIKETVRTWNFSGDHLPFRVTVSIGVSHCPAPGINSPETLFHQADQALYIAKQSGRDRIVTHSPIWNTESRQFFP
jgi:diguanylate cyclase (GGDEF)-like protein